MANTTKEKSSAENVTQNVAQSAPSFKWNSANLHSSYANFCNANSTREEVVLNFGVNNTWDRTQATLEIELNHRVVLSPFAAKRLSTMLQQLMKEYETRYGALSE
ncbi:MAG TPA: DUF3467 domain-containing protein [Methylococcales bacterium]